MLLAMPCWLSEARSQPSRLEPRALTLSGCPSWPSDLRGMQRHSRLEAIAIRRDGLQPIKHSMHSMSRHSATISYATCLVLLVWPDLSKKQGAGLKVSRLPSYKCSTSVQTNHITLGQCQLPGSALRNTSQFQSRITSFPSQLKALC